ncbi:hypothetical protein PN36_15465 [Candidatus Thiomargarita nelsonii]|uniref:LmbE family protein n=1 Tax=Candidatus Thiomargarita nelsonii TaxID=1003181 RepID=A0A0A6P6V7_9GAMM|nr:hypothetical protein PN36_15465 [Candidatus Thiomargarita nelsonii]
MKKETILVFAPHPDDEILGCGAYIAKRRAEGALKRLLETWTLLPYIGHYVPKISSTRICK